MTESVADGVSFAGSDPRGAVLPKQLKMTVFDGARLGAGALAGADLRGSELEGRDLGGADSRGSDLSMCSLRGIDLRGAQLDAPASRARCCPAAIRPAPTCERSRCALPC